MSKITKHLILMASYNEWMNSKMYDAAGTLSAEDLAKDNGGFFRSILGTLNHIMVGDILWLRRFATHPANYHELNPVLGLAQPESLDQILFVDFAESSAQRQMLDVVISRWISSINDHDLEHVLTYQRKSGGECRKDFYGLIMHFFNHQVHHRGQITTMLTQAGLDVGATDLVLLIPDEA
ncbi:DinB family protein [Undibacterium sp. Xuan67W]|uniref:DinB family protein n=1 Tax=Undibacterium sp. Xuan67W TaxID=3413057 RepID=UPI003BF53F7A